MGSCVETQTDYGASSETFNRKLAEAGADMHDLLRWLESESGQPLAEGKQTKLVSRVLAEHFELTTPGEAVLKDKQYRFEPHHPKPS